MNDETLYIQKTLEKAKEHHEIMEVEEMICEALKAGVISKEEKPVFLDKLEERWAFLKEAEMSYAS